MLRRLRVKGFKSLADVAVELPRVAVLFGPNSAGKSNLLDAIQALSRIGTERTLMDALDSRMIRGYAFELFAAAKGRFTEGEGASRSRFSIGVFTRIGAGCWASGGQPGSDTDSLHSCRRFGVRRLVA